ncbi:MAG: hypothetical protein LBU56_03825 [Rickettsiales bacterium]|nr:hypothetical protein [Rickettsiales bacterium]
MALSNHNVHVCNTGSTIPKKSIKKEDYMSIIILSSILGQAGSIFGPIGQIIGSELGALLGAQLDNAIFGLDAEQKVTHGARLKNLQVQTSTYGRTIPIIYGTARVAGNIIWAQPI